jgi:hypothetical protein
MVPVLPSAAAHLLFLVLLLLLLLLLLPLCVPARACE